MNNPPKRIDFESLLRSVGKLSPEALRGLGIVCPCRACNQERQFQCELETEQKAKARHEIETLLGLALIGRAARAAGAGGKSR